MWEFMGAVLERHGLAAAILIAVMVGSAVAIRTLYKNNQELALAMAKTRVEEHEKRSEMRAATTAEVAALKEAYTSEIATMKLHHAQSLAQVQSEWRKDKQSHMERQDDLQERRVAEMQGFVREATTHVASTREEISKIGRSMDVLTDVMTGRRA